MNEMEKISYAVGMNMADYIKSMPLEMDLAMVVKGMQESFAGAAALLPDEYRAAMELCQQKMREAGNAAAEKAAAENAAAGAAFLAENGKKEGVKTTASGLQYEVITEGSGKKPAAADKVRVHYVGTLIDGTEFDSSVRRGEPAEFMLNQVISGWTEGVQLMSAGSKYRFFIPSELAYGSRGAGNSIGPNSTLIFEVELLAVL